jgi:hypothetical protein
MSNKSDAAAKIIESIATLAQERLNQRKRLRSAKQVLPEDDEEYLLMKSPDSKKVITLDLKDTDEDTDEDTDDSDGDTCHTDESSEAEEYTTETKQFKKLCKSIENQGKRNNLYFNGLDKLTQYKIMAEVAYLYKLDHTQYLDKIKELEPHITHHPINLVCHSSLAQQQHTGENFIPLFFEILAKPLPTDIKRSILRNYDDLQLMSPDTSEYFKLQQYIQHLIKIPFGVFKELPVAASSNTPSDCFIFLHNAKQHLDSVVYGMEDVKQQVIQLLGQYIMNPSSMGTAIALHGEAGTGKTSIIKEGISRVLGRPFCFISLGGANDSSVLQGHSYTYEGSRWGKIVDYLMTDECRCMNPIFYFDELDKVSDSTENNDIISVLTHLTDTTQNTHFTDRYFSNIKFNLSKSLFFFSYNDDYKINRILKDRMFVINTRGYKNNEKIQIALKHLIPELESTFLMKDTPLQWDDDTLRYLIETYTDNEAGVRNLKRLLTTIYSKMNICRMTPPDKPNILGLDIQFKPNYKMRHITIDILLKGTRRKVDMSDDVKMMYI